MIWISADEALSALGTKPQTLYANVSRGKIRAKADPGDPRRSLYFAEDVDRLAARQSGRQRSSVVAAQAIRWGDPVLETRISTVSEGRLFYRGRDAVELAENETLESVAALLWETEPFAVAADGGGSIVAPDIAAAFAALAGRAARDFPTLGRGPAILRKEAVSVLSTVASALSPGSDSGLPLHFRLAASWGRPEAGDCLRRALALLAEHELNASTFSARVSASAGASLSACVLSGLATLTGPRHGGAWRGVTALVEAARRLGPEEALRRSLGEAGAVRAYGHPLYPHGDPRARALVGAFALPSEFRALAEVGEAVLGEPINMDFALAALAARYDLPEDAPLILFALARTAGWLAHAMEQAESPDLIRPRANYMGPPV